MNICIDVGNTSIGIGFFEETKLIKRFFVTTDRLKTKDELVVVLKQNLIIHQLEQCDVARIIYSSVVPGIDLALKEALENVFNKKVLSIGPGIKTGIRFNIDNPLEVGNDLVADLVAAKELYGYPCIVADIGTASKVLLIDKNGAFSSALIVPGLYISCEHLSNKTSLLPKISLEHPKSIIAKNTVEAMNAGALYGHSEMIMGLIKRTEKELGYKTKHVLTGGVSKHLKELFDDDYIFNPDLNLIGLNLILMKNEERE